MRKILYASIVSILVLAQQACYKDGGNYDYKDLGAITIEGIEERVTRISFIETLDIEPVVTSTGTPVGELDYTWTICAAYENPNNDRVDIEIDTLTTTKDLHMEVELYPGDYFLYFKAEDPASGVFRVQRMTLGVTTDYMNGFYVAKETPGGMTDIDLFRPANGDVYPEPLYNIINDKEGRSMPGKPVSMGLSTCYSYYRPDINGYEYLTTLNIATETDIRLYTTVAMEALYDHSTMFIGNPPVGEKPLYLRNQGANVGYLSDRGYYSSYQFLPWMMGSGKFGFPSSVTGDEPLETYRPNPNCMAIIEAETTLGFYFFDEIKGRFLTSNFNGVVEQYSYLPTDAHKPTGIEHELVYYGGNRIGGVNNAYAVFNDRAMPGKRYLYIMKPSHSAYSNPIVDVLSLAPGTPLGDADLWAVSERTANMIYFVSGNRFYIYNPADGTGADTPVELEGMGAGEKIVYLAHRFWQNAPSFDNLVVGTEKDGRYKVYLYTRIGAYPDGEPVRILEGEGKLCAVHYANSSMGPGSYQYYSGGM